MTNPPLVFSIYPLFLDENLVVWQARGCSNPTSGRRWLANKLTYQTGRLK